MFFTKYVFFANDGYLNRERMMGMGEIKRILVVDDSAMVHKLMDRFLIGYEIVGFASNGEEGIKLYHEHRPDLTFMDITMPVVDGISAIKGIKQIDQDAKIVMLSAMADEEIVEEAKSLGVITFLQKPFNKETLQRTIHEVQQGG